MTKNGGDKLQIQKKAWSCLWLFVFYFQ